MFNFLKLWFTKKPKTGPNTLEELLNQIYEPSKFDYKPEHALLKFKTQLMFENMELEHLAEQPPVRFMGTWKADMGDGTVVFDWVPVVVLPEILYIYSRNN